jgi:hypothetical protein
VTTPRSAGLRAGGLCQLDRMVLCGARIVALEGLAGLGRNGDQEGAGGAGSCDTGGRALQRDTVLASSEATDTAKSSERPALPSVASSKLRGLLVATASRIRPDRGCHDLDRIGHGLHAAFQLVFDEGTSSVCECGPCPGMPT